MSKLTRLLVVAAALAVVVLSVVAWFATQERLPALVRIAAGKKDGLYDTFARRFADHLASRAGVRVEVIETAGTEENLALLRAGGAELAIVQSDSLGPDGVVALAPLFAEPVHLVVPKGGEVRSVAGLKKRRVALGLVGSGMRQNALTILGHHGLTPADLTDLGEPFAALESGDFDAALVTTGWQNPRLMKLLQTGRFDLVGIADAEGIARRHPWFTATTLPRGLYPGAVPLPPEAVPTVAVTALLAGPKEASNRLVQAALASLYETDLRAAFPAALTAKAARDYDAVLTHPAVAEYHNPYAGLDRFSGMMDFFAKFKELLVAVVAVVFLMWNWARLRRERIAAEEDRVQKTQLDGYIAQTLQVELEQMDVSEPEQLRPYLRRVTHIKQDALRKLTSEKVRGDQLFAIFLAQCAALSEKIQMRMLYGRMSHAEPVTPASP